MDSSARVERPIDLRQLRDEEPGQLPESSPIWIGEGRPEGLQGRPDSRYLRVPCSFLLKSV